jgi:hypothetical protein
MGKQLVVGQGCPNFRAWIVVHWKLHGNWQLANIVILKKGDCCTKNASSNKGMIYNCFGQYASQNNSVISKLKVVPKICVQLQVTPTTRVNHLGGIHYVLSLETPLKFLNESSNNSTKLLFHNFYCIQPIQSRNITQTTC